MSSKKLKSESKTERCFLDANFAASLLQLICSFFTLKERAMEVELTCKHLKAASRHPQSFAGTCLDVTPITHLDRFRAFQKLYSSPRLRRIRYVDVIDEDESTSPQLTILSAAYGTHLQALGIAYDETDLHSTPVRSLELLMIAEMHNLHTLQLGYVEIRELEFLDSLTSLERFACQTPVINFFDYASHTKIIKQVRVLVVTFATDADNDWTSYDPKKRWAPVTHDRDITATSIAQPLDRLHGLVVDAPADLKSDFDLPAWVIKEQPRLIPPWARRLCPNLCRFRKSKSYSLFAKPENRAGPS